MYFQIRYEKVLGNSREEKRQIKGIRKPIVLETPGHLKAQAIKF